MQFSAAICYYCYLDYRTIEGFSGALSKILKIPTLNHSTIYKRIPKFDFKPPALNSREIVTAVDTSRIKVHSREE